MKPKLTTVSLWTHPAWAQTLALEGNPDDTRAEAEKIAPPGEADSLRCHGCKEMSRADYAAMPEINV